jgi:hypothetical protein
MAIRRDNGHERVKTVGFAEDLLTVDLMGGRVISVPLACYPRLAAVSPEACRSGTLSTEGLLRRAPSPELRRQK